MWSRTLTEANFVSWNKSHRHNHRITLIAVSLLIASFLSGCSKFSEGDCIQEVNYGSIWRITAVNFFGEYEVQWWVAGLSPGRKGVWTFPTKGLPSARYVKIACPVS